MSDKPPAKRYVLYFDVVPTWPAPIEQRLRSLLKYAGRVCGLRCTGMQELTDEPTPTEKAT